MKRRDLFDRAYKDPKVLGQLTYNELLLTWAFLKAQVKEATQVGDSAWRKDAESCVKHVAFWMWVKS